MEQEEYKGGAKTPEGKAVSKMNALKHGLLSREVLLTQDDPKALEELGNSITETLMPAGKIEELLVDRIISNTWRLRRALQAERGAMQWVKDYEDMFPTIGGGDKELEKLKEMVDNNSIEKIVRYENSIERGIFKALHELERLQDKRNGKHVPSPVVVELDIEDNSDGSFRKNH